MRRYLPLNTGSLFFIVAAGRGDDGIFDLDDVYFLPCHQASRAPRRKLTVTRATMIIDPSCQVIIIACLQPILTFRHCNSPGKPLT